MIHVTKASASDNIVDARTKQNQSLDSAYNVIKFSQVVSFECLSSGNDASFIMPRGELNVYKNIPVETEKEQKIDNHVLMASLCLQEIILQRKTCDATFQENRAVLIHFSKMMPKESINNHA